MLSVQTRVALACVMTVSAAFAASPSEFQTFPAGTLPGLLYTPTGTTGKVPLIVFMHGIGETYNGTNAGAQVNGTWMDPLLAVAKDTSKTDMYNTSAYLYAPQLPTSWGQWTSSAVDHVMAGVHQAESTYSNIDTNRVYIIGWSLGGGGVWNLTEQYSSEVAAAIPVSCIQGDMSAASIKKLVGKPIWAFAGQYDTTYSTNTNGVINAIRAQDGGKPALSFPYSSAYAKADDYNPNFAVSPYYSYTANDLAMRTPWAYYSEDNNLRYSEFSYVGHDILSYDIFPGASMDSHVTDPNAVANWLFSQAVPEPTSLALLGAGAVLMLRRQRKN